MSLVFWDTMLFIYLVEENPAFGRRVVKLRRRMLERGDRLCTSAMTHGEVLAIPYSQGDLGLAERYKAILSRPQIETIPFTEETAEHFARIREDRTIRHPDAIQLSCAAQARVDLFLTHDRRLARKTIPGIQFIADLSFGFL